MPARNAWSSLQPWIAAPATRWRSFCSARPGVLRVLYALAIILFLGSITIAVYRDPDLMIGVNWALFAVVTSLGVPSTLLLSAARFHVSSAIVGIQRPFRSSIRITVASTTANLLPVPGGLAVRIGALKDTTSNYSDALSVTVATGILWVFSVLTIAGIALLWQGTTWGIMLVVLGTLGVGIATGLLVLSGSQPSQIVFLFLLQVTMLSVEATRIWLCVHALGVEISWSSAAFLTMASVAGSLVGIAPGGFGVRELLASALSPLVALQPEAGLLGTALNGIASMIGLALLMIFDAFFRKNEDKDTVR